MPSVTLPQLSDCHRGVVIDGLETPYCRSLAEALQAVLRALSNRPYIYTVNLSHSYQALKNREREERENEGLRGREERGRGGRDRERGEGEKRGRENEGLRGREEGGREGRDRERGEGG